MSEPKRFRVIFDGQEINETPDGWEDITSTIQRVKDINSIFITTQAELTFMDDGYDYLIAKFEDSFCNKVDVDLQEYCDGVYNTFFIGVIFISSATVDRKNCTIKVQVEDNSFYAKINNNKNIEVFPFAEKTKNGLDITAAAFEQIQLFNTATGGIYATPAPAYSGAAYPVFNLFEYLIGFMTDNSVTLQSNLFGPGGDYEGLTVTCGVMLSQYLSGGTTEADFKDNFQKLSFKKLFEEVNKKVYIGMYVDYNSPTPIVHIERVRDTRQEGTSFRATNIDELTESIDAAELYASVRLGSETLSDKAQPVVSFPANTPFRGFKDQQFFVLGECNIDLELNLVSEFIIDHNIIEDCLENGESSYDDDHIFIMCDVTGGVFISQQNNLSGEAGVFPVFYNIALTGPTVMDNYFNGVPLSIAEYVGTLNNGFFADLTADTAPLAYAVYNTILFDNDSFDPSDNYAPGTGRYTLPAGGEYTFSTTLNAYVHPLNSILYDVSFCFEHYNNAAALIQRYEYTQGTLAGVNVYSQSITITGATGDYVIVTFKTDVNQVEILDGSSYECTSTSDGGGIYKVFDPLDYPAYRHKWEYPLTLQDFKSIAENQTLQIEFARHNEKTYSGYIDSVKFKRFGNEMGQFVTYRATAAPVAHNEAIEMRYVLVTGQLPDVPFDITPDFYGIPFGGNGTTTKTYFYPVGTDVTVTIQTPYLGVPVNPAVYIYIVRYFTGGSVGNVYTNLSVTFTVEPDSNYFVQTRYDLTVPGSTYPDIEPFTTPPVTAGANGTAFFVATAPLVLADFTFLWNTGAVTDSINAPAGNYWCQVTNVNPGTYDNNVVTFNIQIPVSETGA